MGKDNLFRRHAWYTSDFLELGGSTVCILSAVASAFMPSYVGATAIATALGAAVSVATKVFKAKRSTNKNITSGLFTLHAGIASFRSMNQSEADEILRITFHQVDEVKDEVTQLVDYVGRRGGSGGGRTFRARWGIVGKAIVTGEPVNVHRSSELKPYLDAMARDFGMSPKDVVVRDNEARSFLAVPLPSQDNRTTAALYLDATVEHFFDEETIGFVSDSCQGIARYLE